MKNLISYSIILFLILIVFTNCNPCKQVIMVDHIGYSDKYVPTCYISTDTIEIELISDFFILVSQSKFEELSEYISGIDEKYSVSLDTMSWWDFHIKVSSCDDNIERYLDGSNSIILYEGLNELLSDVKMSEYSRYELTYNLVRIKKGMSFIEGQ